MIKLFGTKQKAIAVISITILLITMSVILKESQFEMLFILLAYAIPTVVVFTNLMNNPEPKKVRVRSGFKLMLGGVFCLMIVNTVLNLIRY